MLERISIGSPQAKFGTCNAEKRVKVLLSHLQFPPCRWGTFNHDYEMHPSSASFFIKLRGLHLLCQRICHHLKLQPKGRGAIGWEALVTDLSCTCLQPTSDLQSAIHKKAMRSSAATCFCWAYHALVVLQDIHHLSHTFTVQVQATGWHLAWCSCKHSDLALNATPANENAHVLLLHSQTSACNFSF